MPLFQGCWQLDNFYNPVDAKRKHFTDCYFFYYSACKNGGSCQYRHEPSALGHEVMCSRWLEGRCEDVHCKERHMLIGKRRDRTPCFWENTPFGCKKAHCVFKHSSTKIGRITEESDPEEFVKPFIPNNDQRITYKEGKTDSLLGEPNDSWKETIKILNAESNDKLINEIGTQDTTERNKNMNSRERDENKHNMSPLQVPSIKIISTDDNEYDPIDENLLDTLEISSGIDSLGDSKINTDLSLIITDISGTTF